MAQAVARRFVASPRGFSSQRIKSIKQIALALACSMYVVIAGAASNSLNIADAAISQPTSTTNLPFALSLTGDTSYDVAVQYTTADDTAIAGTDYTAVSGSVLIPGSAASGTLNVPVLGKTGAQPARDFKVNLSNPVGVGPRPTFGPPSSFNAYSGPVAMVSADLDGDGRLDVAVAANKDDVVSFLMNTTAPGAANAVFNTTGGIIVGTGPRAVDAADLNGDGLPDLMVVNNGSNDVAVLINNTVRGSGNPTFASKTSFGAGNNPQSVKAVDLNGDGRPDMVIADSVSNSISVLINNTAPGATTPVFSAITSFAVGATPLSLTVADFNGDGRPDLAIANSGDNTVSVLLNTTAPGAAVPSFAPVSNFAAGSGPNSITTADFNGDGRPDLAMANLGDNSVSVLINTSTPGTTSPSFAPAASFAAGNLPYAVTTADLNGDGRPDLAVVNLTSGTATVLYNTSALGGNGASFTSAGLLPVGNRPQAIIAADFNGDGLPDLAAANNANDNVSVLINATLASTAIPTFTPQQSFATLANNQSVATVDVNGDGRPDLVTAGYGPDAVSVLVNTTPVGAGTVSYAALQSFAGGANPDTVVGADFNGDGKPDLVVANNGGSGDTISVLVNTAAPGAATASFAAPQSFPTAANYASTSNPRLVAAADINGDGRPDVIVANFISGSVSVLLNTTAPGSSTVSFTPQQSFASGPPASVACVDINGDGRPDLVVGSANGPPAVLINTTAPGATVPSFAAIQNFGTSNGGLVNTADVNGDGRPDLLLANPTGKLSVLLNTTAPGAATASFATSQDFTSSTTGGPFAVTTADVNGDGRPDLIAVNSYDSTVSVLINTTAPGATTLSFAARQPFATGKTPQAIGIADFNGDGLPDLVAANYADKSVSVLLNTRFSPTLGRAQATGTINAVTGPSIVLNPTTLSFTNQPVSSLSASQTVTLTNSGTAALSISSIGVTGTNASDFSQTNNCPTSLPQTAGSNSCTITVSFTPGATGSRTASLSVASNASSVPATVALTGNGVARAPAFTLSSDLGFGSQPVNTTAAAQSVTVTNSGNVPLTSIGATASGTNPTDFALTSNTCPTSLATGGTCTLSFTFTPAAAGARSAIETIAATDNTSGGAVVTNTVNVSGTGTQPGISLSSSTVAFGNQRVGTSSAGTTVVLTNSGNGTLTLMSFSASAPFAQTTDCPTTLAAGSSCNVFVSFSPVTAGAVTGTLSIGSNAPTSPTTATLSGTGVAPALSVSTPSDFGSVMIGSSSPAQPITVSNNGTASLTINSLAIGGTNAGDFGQTSTCPVSPATLAGGSNCSVQVSFTPTAQGSRSGSLVVTTADAGTSTQALSGTGTNNTPGSFSLTPITGVDPASVQTSNTITVSNTNAASAISISSPGQYRINSGPYTSAAGTVNPGDTVQVQLTASSSFATQASTSLTIGGVSAEFDVTTRAAKVQATAFSFMPVSGVTPNTLVMSNSITISGIEVAIPVSITGGSYSLNGGAYTTAASTVSNGDTVIVAQTAAASFSTTTTATLTVGSGGNAVSGGFAVTTVAAATTPNAFGFGSLSNVALSSVQTSNAVTPTGTNTASPISVTGGSYSLNGGAFTTANGTINPGDAVAVRVIASSQFSTPATVILTIGGVQGSFTVTTLAADTTPDAFSFNALTGVPLSTVQTSNAITVTGINTASPVSITGGSYSITPNGSSTAGAYTTAAGTVNPGDQVTLQQTSSGSFSTATTATLSIGSGAGAVSGGFTVTTLATDTDPNAFTFGSVTGVTPGSVQTSPAVTITGLNTASPISVSGGSYAINGGAFTTTAGSINPGDSVQVQGSASSSFSTTTQVTLSIGTNQGNFGITTLAADTTPDSYSFMSVAGVNPGSVQTSNAITVTGINTGSPISITGGSYSINGGAFTTAPGTVNANDKVTVQETASSSFGTTTQATLTIGSVSASFTVTTLAADTTPDAFAFTAVTGVNLSSVQTSNAITVSGINTAAPVSVSGGSYSLNGGAFTTAAGSVNAGDQVRVQETASSSFGTTTQATLTIGTTSASFTVTTLAADTTPDAFGFNAVTGVNPGSTQTSNAITVTGINTASPISVSGGRYSINGGAYTTAAGTVNLNDQVTVQETASSSFSTTTQAALTIGTTSASFTVTTLAADTTPDAFSFTPVTGVNPSSVQTSNAITVTGINTASPISITGGSYSINGGAFTTTAGTTNPGDSVAVQVIASSQFSTPATVTLTIGGVQGSFTATTVAADTTPDAFSFGNRTNVAVSSVQSSGSVTPTGFDAPVALSVSGGRYSLNGGAFTAAAGTLNPGDAVVVQVTASAQFATATTVTLTAGSGAGVVSGSFTVTTVAADTTPDAFSFNPVTAVMPSSQQTSNAVTITGINTAAPVSITGGSYSINGGAFTTAAGSVNAGDSLRLLQTASASYSSTTSATLTVGGVSGRFDVTTIAATTNPAAFTFGAVTGVAPGSVQTSGSVTVSGINSASPVSVAGGSYSLNGGAFTTTAGSLNPGDTVAVRTTASPAFGTTVVVTLTIGTTQGTYSVTTTAADTAPDGFSFGSVGGVAPGSVQTSNPVTITGINTASPISISGGSYSINGGAFTTTAGSLNPGDQVTVQLTASTALNSATQAVLTIGGISASFVVSTQAADTTPDGFIIPPVSGATPGGTVTSAPITPTGLNTTTPVSVSTGCLIIAGGSCVASGTLSPGQSFTVNVTADPTYCTPVTATVTVGTVSAPFTVTSTCTVPEVNATAGGGGAVGPGFLALLASLGLLRKRRRSISGQGTSKGRHSRQYRGKILTGTLLALPLATLAASSTDTDPDSVDLPLPTISLQRLFGGVGVGSINSNVNGGYLQQSLAARGFTGLKTRTESDGVGGSVNVGYALLRHLDLRFSYTLGEDVKVHAQGTVPPGTQLHDVLDAVGDKVRGYGDAYALSLQVHGEILPRLELAPRIGYFIWNTQVEVDAGSEHLEAEHSGGGLTMGATLSYRIWKGLRLGVAGDYFRSTRYNHFGLVSGVVEWRPEEPY